jgi:hypothetical protein
VRKITFAGQYFAYRGDSRGATRARQIQGNAVMQANITGSRPTRGRAFAFALLLALLSSGSVRADLATPEQKRACTPDVYRLCAGEIPNVRAITACLRRQRSNLSDACRAVFEQ